VKTVNVYADTGTVTFSKAVVESTINPSQTPFDQAACIIYDTDYTIEQVNYSDPGDPTSLYDPNLLTFEVDQEDSNDASRILFHSDRNSYV